ncbi:LysM peptidoglycan-binding domain-containing protein [Minwuia sp.]|uniref:LysM peptidoglycan-binding domain-containing protein n=1 Tax=Minwuia sp. TaxID=2493630 RepID=UPI003A933342
MNRNLLIGIGIAILLAIAVYFVLQDDDETVAVDRSPPASDGSVAGDGEPASGSDRNPVSDAAADITEKADESVEAVGEAVADAVDEAAETAGKAASDVAEAVKDTAREAAEVVTDAVDKAGKKVREAGKALSDAADSSTKDVGEAGEKVTKAVTETVATDSTAPDRDTQAGQPEAGAGTSSDDGSVSAGTTGSQSETRTAALPPLNAPSFDVVRISNRDCTAVIAGRATPLSTVTLTANGDVLATIQADGAGEWSHLHLDALTPGPVTLSLQAEKDGRVGQAENDVVLIVPDCAEPSNDQTAIALLTPRSGEATKVLQAPAAAGDDASPEGLNVGKVDYTENGRITLSGTSELDGEVRVYVDDVLMGRARVDADGRWNVIPDAEIAPGLHTLRVDQVDGSGKVLARVELPFSRAEPEVVKLANAQFIVQPGNSLWRIARRTYGAGVNYTVIYQANSDRIRDPDLIYPGQVFRLPPLEE